MRIDQAVRKISSSTKNSESKSWMLGYLSALDDFAIYQDGERFIGALHTSLGTVIDRKLQEWDVTDAPPPKD